MAAEAEEQIKRTHIRVKPDYDDFCLIDTNPDGDFEPTIGAFIVNEAVMAGCGLVTRTSDGLKTGMNIQLKLGKLSPLLGEVVWTSELDSDLTKVGIKLLE